MFIVSNTGITGYVIAKRCNESDVYDLMMVNMLNAIYADKGIDLTGLLGGYKSCLLYTSPSPRDRQKSRMPSSA